MCEELTTALTASRLLSEDETLLSFSSALTALLDRFFIGCGSSNELVLDDRLFGLIGCEGLVVANWSLSGDCVFVAAVVVATSSVAAASPSGWGIFLVALIGLESTGAHSTEFVDHIIQIVSVQVKVNTSSRCIVYSSVVKIHDASKLSARTTVST